jgi:hypothetical protein
MMSNPPAATTDVEIEVELRGDYGNSLEYADLYLNGEFLSRLNPGVGCAEEISVFTIVVPAAIYNQTVSFNLDLELRASVGVDATECPDNYSRMRIRYGINDTDCDGNGVLDACQIGEDPSLDADNDGRLDTCANGQAAPCPGDANGDNAVDLADLNTVLGAFGTAVAPGTGADFDGNGMVDLADLNLVLGNFGTSCTAGLAGRSTFGMSLEGEEMPVTAWLMLKNHPDAQAWLDSLEPKPIQDQKDEAEELKEFVEPFQP